MKRVLCVWLPNWPIQRLVVERPELRFSRIILWQRDSRRGQLVSAVSPLATRDGVKINMPLSEARSLLKKAEQRHRQKSKPGKQTPPPSSLHNQQSNLEKAKEQFRLAGGHPRYQARVTARTISDIHPEGSSNHSTCHPQADSREASQPHDSKPAFVYSHAPDSDRETLLKLTSSCQNLAPIVGTSANEVSDCIYLDVTNLDRLYGSEDHLLLQVIEHFQERQYTIRAAIADTISVAWGLSHYSQEEFSIAPADEGIEALRELSVRALRLEPATCETLRQLGIDQVDQLLQLPRASLTSRFGDEIHLRLDQAAGIAKEVFAALQPPIEYRAEELLEWPIKDIPTTLVVIQRLIEKLCQQMKAAAQGAMQWQVILYRQQAHPIQLDIKLFQPTTTAPHVMQLVEMQLETHPEFLQRTQKKKRHFIRQSPIIEIVVHVTHCVQLAEKQRKLFDEDPSLNRMALAQLINRLTSRLGQEQVTRPILQAGAQPEFSYRLKPLVDPTRRRAKTQQTRSHYVMSRPLRLLSPAIPLHPGPASETLPTTFQVQDSRVIHVQRHWGPERIETGWWRGKTVCRDYWRIETNTGSQLWIYRDRRKGDWFLQGEF